MKYITYKRKQFEVFSMDTTVEILNEKQSKLKEGGLGPKFLVQKIWDSKKFSGQKSLVQNHLKKKDWVKRENSGLKINQSSQKKVMIKNN